MDGTTWWIATDGGSVSNISPDTEILAADFQIDKLEAKMDYYAAVPPESYGFKTPGEQTKFQVSERVNAAGLMFFSKISKFENQMITPSVNAELELAKVHLDENLQVPVSTEEGDIFEEITPLILKNQGTLIAVGARHYKQQARLVQELRQFMEAMQMDPEMKMHFSPKKLAKAWNSLLGGFGSTDGIYEEYGRLVESVETQQRQQAAGALIDNSALAQQSLDEQDPEFIPQ